MSAWSPRPGLHLVHKPVGATSFQLVQEAIDAAAKLGLKQLPVCHGGALDPFAEGLVLLLVGPATKLMDLVHAAPKTYRAEVAWGAETDTGDHLGKPVLRGDAGALEASKLDELLARFVGWHDQVPPATSNKRVDGERAYQRAHRGEQLELPASRVYLHAARWTAHSLPVKSALELTCGGGYYVRALARELGRALGCGAHLSALSRTSVGPWRDPAGDARPWVHGRGLVPWLRSRALSDDELELLRRDRPIGPGTLDAPEWPLPEGFDAVAWPVRALHADKLVALLRLEGEGLRAEPMFRTPI